MVLMIDLKQSESGCMNNLTVECYVSKLQFVKHTGSTSKMCKTQHKGSTYNMKSCSQQGLLPLTSTVVDLTFCSFKTTYVLKRSETIHTKQ